MRARLTMLVVCSWATQLLDRDGAIESEETVFDGIVACTGSPEIRIDHAREVDLWLQVPRSTAFPLKVILVESICMAADGSPGPSPRCIKYYRLDRVHDCPLHLHRASEGRGAWKPRCLPRLPEAGARHSPTGRNSLGSIR